MTSTVLKREPTVRGRSQERPRPQPAKRWNVVLLDDMFHTDVYVIKMMATIFRYPTSQGRGVAYAVDRVGRVVVWTGHRELAEMYRDRIMQFGPDPLLPRTSHGSMGAEIEEVAE